MCLTDIGLLGRNRCLVYGRQRITFIYFYVEDLEDMSQKLRIINSSLLVTSLLALGLGAGNASASTSAQAGGANWQAVVGHEIFTEQGQKGTWQSERFYPEALIVSAGDSITWKFDSGVEPHTVTFLGADGKFPDMAAGPPPGAGGPGGGGAPGGPGGAGGGIPPQIPGNPLFFFKQGGASYDGSTYVNSGVLSASIPGAREYTLNFPKPGTYRYICLIHSGQDPQTGKVEGMVGTLVVQAAGGSTSKTQAQINSDIKAQADKDETKARELEVQVKKSVNTPTAGPNGTKVYHAIVGYTSEDPAYPLAYMRFVYPRTSINVGDTVEWTSPTGGFHNVVFGGEADIFSFQPQPNGPPNVFLNTKALLPAGGATYTGSGFYNSGILEPPNTPPGQEGGPFPSAKQYSLTFTQAGTYHYVCSIHDEQGMAADVIVGNGAGGSGEPGMPRTGSSNDWLYGLLALGMAFGMALAAGGVALRLRGSAKLN